MAKVTTTVTNIFAAFRRDLNCTSGFPPPVGGIWLICDARDDTANTLYNYSYRTFIAFFFVATIMIYTLLIGHSLNA